MKFRWLRSLTIMPRELPKKIKRENRLSESLAYSGQEMAKHINTRKGSSSSVKKSLETPKDERQDHQGLQTDSDELILNLENLAKFSFGQRLIID
jgi:hypothetical protein